MQIPFSDKPITMVKRSSFNDIGKKRFFMMKLENMTKYMILQERNIILKHTKNTDILSVLFYLNKHFVYLAIVN